MAHNQDPVAAWRKQVHEEAGGRCCNCGSGDRLQVIMIVPEEAGGQLTVSNGRLLCRACEMAAEAVKAEKNKEGRRIVQLWVSQRLHKDIKGAVKQQNGFRSMSQLARYLISRYVSDERLYDDLVEYKDVAIDPVKINVWVDREAYDEFRAKLKEKSITVQDGLTGLLRMFEAEAASIVEGGKTCHQ
jgi:hypothetical protein